MAPSKLQKRRGGPPSIGGPANSGPTIRDFAEEIEAELSRDARSSALHAAARRGNKELAELALSEGGRINHLDSEGKTALLVAVEGKRKELAMWLLSKGADPFQQDAMGADCGSFVDIEMGISAAKEKVAADGPGSKPQKDVAALAEHLGIKAEEMKNLQYIAEAALHAQVPYDWSEHCDSNGAVFFYNKSSGQSSWEHPMDPFYKLLVDKARQAGNRKGASSKSSAGAGRTPMLSSATPTDTALSSMQTPHIGRDGSSVSDMDHARHQLPSWRQDASSMREHTSASHLSNASSNHGSSPSKDSPPKASSHMAAAEDFDVDQILGMGKHRGARGSDDLLGAIRGGRLDAVDEVNAQERRRNQGEMPRGNRGAVQKLSMDVKSLRGQYEGFRDLVQKELNVSREMATLRAAVFRMVNTVRHSDSNAKAAEELALREREKYEQAQSEMQEIRGNIRVFCRVRKATTTDPLQERGDAATISFPADDAICVRDGEQRRTFHFDRVYDQEASQSMIFADVRPMIASAMEGFNTCVLAYGQTGSGKTYTMEGPVQDPGIHFRAVKDMFDMRNGHKSVRSYDFSISVLEVHNERVFDLLVDPRTAAERRKTRHDLPIKVDVVRGVAVEGLTEFPVESVQSMVETIELAAGNRAQGVTSANEHSSRSHLIITIGVRGEALATGKKWHGKLHLVDLAGSERLGGGAGMRAEESRMINKSLSALHDVFTALKQREKHIPYRNSKLTQLLQDSLAGNSKVLMMLTVSPRRGDARESTSSLTLAKRVKSIVLGGAKREVENKEYIKISEGHERQVEELRGRISTLEAQLRNALGAAKQNADDKSRKVTLESKKRAEERRAWGEERERLEREKKEAEETANSFKAQLVRASAESLPADPRAAGGAFVPRPPAHRDGAVYPGGRNAAMVMQEEGYNDSGSVSVMGSVSNMSMFGGGIDRDESQRVQAWKTKVAELKMALEERERRERKLSLDLRAKVDEIQGLKDKLAAAERRMMKQLAGAGGSDYPSVPLYERVNNSVSLRLPSIPTGGGDQMYPRQPHTDRTDLHRRKRHDPESGRMMQLY